MLIQDGGDSRRALENIKSKKKAFRKQLGTKLKVFATADQKKLEKHLFNESSIKNNCGEFFAY